MRLESHYRATVVACQAVDCTADLDRLWPQIPDSRFTETVTAFGQYTNVVYKLIAYAVDNEIRHRGQWYVYLRALGIEPPLFHIRT